MRSFKKVSKAIFASMLLASVASSSMLSVSAADMVNSASDIKNHFIGVVGSFNGWTDDIQLMDKDNDGIYEGLVQIPEVTEDMFIIQPSFLGRNTLSDSRMKRKGPNTFV